MTTGDVEINIIDGGAAVVVPGASVRVVIGCSSDGEVAQPVATQDPNTLKAIFGKGPLVESGGLIIVGGGTVIACKADIVTAATASAVTTSRVGSSTCVVTVTGTPYDDYLVKMVVVTGGTKGTPGIRFKLSLDAGRHYGPTLALGAASTYTIPETGVTLNFATGTLDAGDNFTFYTTAPIWDTGSIQDCLDALKNSSFAVAGWGGMHIVGPVDGTDAATIGTAIDALADSFIYTRVMMHARDADIPTVWGGPGETETDWITSVTTDFGALEAKRILVAAGHYNIASAYPNPSAGSPTLRRSLSYALAARQVQIPPQRHAGRVRDGSLKNINIDPTKDPTDGFIYHDERIVGGFDQARFASARTRIGLPGFYNVNPNLMSPLGSIFTLLPLGNVMDVACAIVHQVGQRDINSDIRLNPTGTIYENEALAIEARLYGQIKAQMIDNAMISSATVTVNRSTNILATSTVKVTVQIVARGYILEEDIDIGFKDPFAAGA